MWDYLNRMLASGYNNSTTTYAYDPSGARVLQTSTTSTTYYPSKYYSFTSTKIGANTYATSTNYIWNGDTLLATIDQPLYNGSATGSPITRYIHPDHLGSTNVVTDASGTVAQLLDYYPYGATRVSSNTYPTYEKRQYIGQFADAQTSLNYFNARYYDGARGQFLSEDPLFWDDQKQLGTDLQMLGTAGAMKASNWKSPAQNHSRDYSASNWVETYLRDPQAQNPYGYSRDNPIRFSDPAGLWYKEFFLDNITTLGHGQSWASFQLEVGDATDELSKDSPSWNFAINHPKETGIVVGIGAAVAASTFAGGIVGPAANPTTGIVGVINAYSVKDTVQAYTGWRATGSSVAGGQVVYDSLVTAAAALGTAKQEQALNLLSAALTLLQAMIQAAAPHPQSTSRGGVLL